MTSSRPASRVAATPRAASAARTVPVAAHNIERWEHLSDTENDASTPAATPRAAASDDHVLNVIEGGDLSDDAALRILKAKLRVMQARGCTAISALTSHRR